MKIKLFLVLFVFTALAEAQVKFEPGYIVNNNGDRIDCLIKNSDWISNPEEIFYKISENTDEVIRGNTTNIKEFGIGDFVVYKRFRVDLDMSSNSMVYMSNKREPEFETNTLFLKLLVKGDANLYYYEGKNIYRFFYKFEESTEIIPLIFKKYKVDNIQVGTNAEFRSTLYYNFKCDGLTAEDSRNIRYDKKDLINFFVQYNNCKDSESQVFVEPKSKGQFKLKGKVGVMAFNVKTGFTASLLAPDLFSAKLTTHYSFRIGGEIEYILPFNKNKWGVFIEPSYQAYNGSGQNIRPRNDLTGSPGFINEIEVSYSYIDFPIGVRHYMFINNNSKIFLNGGIVMSLNLDGEVTYSLSQDYEIATSGNLFFGLGYELNNKISVEFRYATNRNLTSSAPQIATQYSGVGLIFGYSFF